MLQFHVDIEYYTSLITTKATETPPDKEKMFFIYFVHNKNLLVRPKVELQGHKAATYWRL